MAGLPNLVNLQAAAYKVLRCPRRATRGDTNSNEPQHHGHWTLQWTPTQMAQLGLMDDSTWSGEGLSADAVGGCGHNTHDWQICLKKVSD